MRSLLIVVVLAGCFDSEVGRPTCPTQASDVLPTSRNTNCTPADPVLSNDLNDIQDCIVGMKQPPHWRWFGFPRAGRETNIAFDTTGGLWAGVIRATANAALYDGGVIQGIPVGTRITGIAARILGTGAAQNVTVTVWKSNSTGMSVIGTATAVDPPAAYATYSNEPLAVPKTVADEDLLIVSASIPLDTTHIMGFGLKLDRL